MTAHRRMSLADTGNDVAQRKSRPTHARMPSVNSDRESVDGSLMSADESGVVIDETSIVIEFAIAREHDEPIDAQVGILRHEIL